MSTRGSYCSFVGVLDRLATHGNAVLTAKRLGAQDAGAVRERARQRVGRGLSVVRGPLPVWSSARQYWYSYLDTILDMSTDDMPPRGSCILATTLILDGVWFRFDRWCHFTLGFLRG